ncbi:spore-associated protein A [Nonomuraea terrae]|uniref:spore-associated protein A n=1 Tax=Nonomuraea terrae TaxID=2530383 RepID=UPI0037A79092
MIKSVPKVVAATALAAGVLVANPAYTANAASAAYTPEGVCGAGYARVKDGTRALKSGRDTFGYVYLLYNRSNGYNCVVTIKTAFYRTATYTTATLTVKGSKPKTDAGKFKYYAGPVKLKARGECVSYWGSTRDTRLDFAEATGGRKTFGNCG